MRKVMIGIVAVVIVAAGVGGVAYHACAGRKIAVPQTGQWSAPHDPDNPAAPSDGTGGTDGTGGAIEPTIGTDGTNGSDEANRTDDTDRSKELIAVVDTREEAEEIAELYNITLKSYASHVAVYTTDRDVSEVIAEGERNGYPELSRNRKSYRLVESNE